MHKSRLGALVVDCQSGNLIEYTEFWGSVLGSEPESQEGQINQRYVRLNGVPSEAQVILQKVDHPSRVHLDRVRRFTIMLSRHKLLDFEAQCFQSLNLTKRLIANTCSPIWQS